MKYQEKRLSGQWELCWTDTGTGKPDAVDSLFEKGISCPVPGDVHMALTRAGIISEPIDDLNSLDCRWMEQKEFWYRRRFYVEESFLQDACELVLEGLDLTADIWLNGQYVGSHNNAFIEKIVDVSSCLKAGENTLVVRIDDGVYGVRHKDAGIMEHSWNNEQPYRAWMRKPQYVYGWDWTVWLPSCGIWKDVYLRSFRKGAIRDLYIQTRFSGESIRQAEEVTLDIRVETELLQKGGYTLNITVSGDKRFGGGETLTGQVAVRGVGAVEASLSLTLRAPRLWWPNGAGEPYLYTVTAELCDDAGEGLCSLSHRHGLRTVSLRQQILDAENSGFTFIINGEPIFCKGANHVPADCFPGRITDEKNRALLQAAADAHMNMIRVWGGGVYESDGFMDACDELGLMVWHDFMFACGYYPDHDPEFFEELQRETAAVIRRLRSHSSLIGWSGNNEIQEMYKAACDNGLGIPWYGGRIYEELLPGAVQALCPDRIYRESSPFGGECPAGFEIGDQHVWHFTHRPGWEHYLDLWRFTDFDFKFLSEFGVIGAMNLESAKKCIRPEALHPGSPEWKHHTNTSQEHTLLDVFVRKYFGYAPENVQSYILHSQVLQAEIMRHIYDELRSRKFRCSGILLWTLSDSYGIHNWSVIDYYLGKRPLYYYLKRSMAPVNVTILGYEAQNFEGKAHYRDYYQGAVKPMRLLVTNDQLHEQEVTLRWRIMTFGGEVLRESTSLLTAPANGVLEAEAVDISAIAPGLIPEKTILQAELLSGCEVIHENRYFFAPYGALALENANIQWKLKQQTENTARLTLTSDTFVWMLHMADSEGIVYSDNDFDLLPGESRTVLLTGNVTGFTPALHSLNPSMEIKEARYEKEPQ